jgi:Mg2+-importing ATPase
MPAEKLPGVLSKDKVSDTSEWTNYLFMGTSVISGSATAVVVRTGRSTQYAQIVERLSQRRPVTEFERSSKKFGYLIMQVTVMLVVAVFLINALNHRDLLQSLLFSIALAVGLTPELLPLIITVNLTEGALHMSRKDVVVKRLESIQNYGSMDVLCTDKTGTLTENKVTLVKFVNALGNDDEKVLQLSYLNSFFETGFKSPLDGAILTHKEVETKEYEKLDEIPFDFVRKRVSVVVRNGSENIMITKGAPEEMLKCLRSYELEGKEVPMDDGSRDKISSLSTALSTDGLRLLGVAYKKVDGARTDFKVADEAGMVFVGFVAFLDPPKESAKDSIKALEKSGIQLKIITGDSELVTKKVCRELNFEISGIVLGKELEGKNDAELRDMVEKANIFARVNPTQKNDIIVSLRKNGHVVGFLGDGVNDSPSIRTADVGISVNNAVDVAKESADIILMKNDLRVLNEGVLEGRKTFANTTKYIQMGISSNFGNMFSVAGASLFLPFLPMLAIQILLLNLIYNLSQMTIPTDNVDDDYIEKPKRMDIRFIRNFMIFFGPISSIFDFLTFGVLIFYFHASGSLFQTAWFVESLATQSLIIFAIRTRISPFFKSRPSIPLIVSSFAVVAIGLILPYSPLAGAFSFVSLPLAFYGVLIVFVGSYFLLVELLKTWFYRHYSQDFRAEAEGHILKERV